MEHVAASLQEDRSKTVYVYPLKDGLLDMQDLRASLSERTIVSITHASNVLGWSIRSEIARLAHEVGAIMVVDGRLNQPHMAIDGLGLRSGFLCFLAIRWLHQQGLVSSMGRKKS